MATYEYRCERCKWEGEIARIPIDDRDLQFCPNILSLSQQRCGEKLERLISAVAATRFGFGFTPSISKADGTTVTAPKKRPSSARKG